MNVKYKATKWVPLIDIPSATSYVTLGKNCIDYWKNYTNGAHVGVYQVSLKKPTDVVHKDICYIGKSDCLPKRLSDLRSAAGANNKVAHHMCGVYIREEKINIDNVYVRCVLSDDEHELERWLHQEHKQRFGYKVGYAWEEASGGYKSCRIQSQMSIKRLNSLDACLKVQEVLNERIKELKLMENK